MYLKLTATVHFSIKIKELMLFGLFMEITLKVEKQTKIIVLKIIHE